MDFDARFDKAIQAFWDTRTAQMQKQEASGKVDAGTRGAVTGGGHLGAFEALCADVLTEAGIDASCIKRRSMLEIPGYYRSEKKWDLLVVRDGLLLMALEFKSMVGSFGNNSNNRAEEVVGNAEDLWAAYREGRFGASPQPFVGYFYVLQDDPKVHRPVRNAEPHFPVDSVFKGATRAERFEVLLRRLVLQRKYTAACLTLTQNGDPPTWRHPTSDLSWHRFAAGMRGAVIASGKI